MATHLGKEGIIKVGVHTVAEVRNWSLNSTVDTVDASTLGDDWKVHKTTQKSWHGSLSCFWDASDTAGQGELALGASVTLSLYPEGDSAHAVCWTGQALITGIDYSGAPNGLVEANMTFQGNGALNPFNNL